MKQAAVAFIALVNMLMPAVGVDQCTSDSCTSADAISRHGPSLLQSKQRLAPASNASVVAGNVCGAWQNAKRCDGESTTTLGPIKDEAECASKCAAQNVEGCCRYFHEGRDFGNGNGCIFYNGVQKVANFDQTKSCLITGEATAEPVTSAVCGKWKIGRRCDGESSKKLGPIKNGAECASKCAALNVEGCCRYFHDGRDFNNGNGCIFYNGVDKLAAFDATKSCLTTLSVESGDQPEEETDAEMEDAGEDDASDAAEEEGAAEEGDESGEGAGEESDESEEGSAEEAEEEVAKCKGHCEKNTNSWTKKCTWAACSGCPSCSDGEAEEGDGGAAEEAEEEVAKCKGTCEKNTNSWTKKCKWAACSGCSSCSDEAEEGDGGADEAEEEVAQCKGTCEKNTNSWIKKCKWAACSGCSSCSDGEAEEGDGEAEEDDANSCSDLKFAHEDPTCAVLGAGYRAVTVQEMKHWCGYPCCASRPGEECGCGKLKQLKEWKSVEVNWLADGQAIHFETYRGPYYIKPTDRPNRTSKKWTVCTRCNIPSSTTSAGSCEEGCRDQITNFENKTNPFTSTCKKASCSGCEACSTCAKGCLTTCKQCAEGKSSKCGSCRTCTKNMGIETTGLPEEGAYAERRRAPYVPYTSDNDPQAQQDTSYPETPSWMR